MSAKARFENDIKHTRQASNNQKAKAMLDAMNEYFPEYGERSDEFVNGYHHAYFLAKMWLLQNR
jgi:hypothetical protein